MGLTIIKKSSDYLDYILDGLEKNYEIIDIESHECQFWRLMHLLFNGRTDYPTRFLSSYLSSKTLRNLKSVSSDKVLILGAVDSRTCNIINKFLPATVEKNIWIWNGIKPSANVTKNGILQAPSIKIYVYSNRDAEIYGYPYKSPVYRKQVPYAFTHKSDFFWIGKPKNRKELILSLKNELEALGYKCDFRFVESKEDYIPYKQQLEIAKSTNCIVDINDPSNAGFSLRVMEALFFNKKLITTNKFVLSCDFYNSSNIFVLGVDNDVKSFMSGEYICIPNEIKNRYDINNWIKEFE